MITTGENLAYRTLEEVEAVMLEVKKLRTRDGNDTIELHHMEGNATVHVFPEFVMGWKEIGGDSLASIMESSENQTLQEMKAEAANLNLYSTKRTT